MHDTAYEIGGAFIRAYGKTAPCIVVEIGSMDVNGSLREHIDPSNVYLGLDVEHGKNVDLVIDPLKPLPLRDNFADIVLSSSQMEHDKFFWKTFLELIRVTKDGGYVYISSPSNGDYHSYPIDCWRFYPEAGLALAEWASTNGMPCTLIESFTAGRKADYWNDYVAIFQKCPPEQAVPGKLLSSAFTAYNVRTVGSDEVANKSERTEDFLLMIDAREKLAAAQDEIRILKERVEILERDLSAAQAQNAAAHEAQQRLIAAQDEIRALNEKVGALEQGADKTSEAAAHEAVEPVEAQQPPAATQDEIRALSEKVDALEMRDEKESKSAAHEAAE